MKNSIRYLLFAASLFNCSSSDAGIRALLEAAAKKHNVPAGILISVCTWESQTYSDGVRQPWPWTLNRAGEPLYLKNYISAVLALRHALATGEQNVDIGLCQINWRWHKQNFKAPEELLNPKVNAEYASLYLSQLKTKDLSWEQTVGRYHSPGCASCAQAYSRRALQLKN